MVITRAAHEAALAQLEASLDARGLPESAGIHGPDSISWAVNGEVLNFLGGGRAILLQLAHPYVAYAIAEHSVALSDARKRFQGTFDNIYRMAFGTRSEALRSARTIHGVHARIHGSIGEDVGRFGRGDRYQGNDRDALLWVHATLTDTALCVHDAAGRRLQGRDRERLYEESKGFALLFGLDASIVPASLDDFQRYVREQFAGDTLAVSTPAREIADFILKAPNPVLEPLFRVYRAVTSQFLPERLRRAYGLPFGARERRLAWLATRTLRSVRRALPAGARLMPAVMQAEMRLGLRGASALSRAVERVINDGLSLYPSEGG